MNLRNRVSNVSDVPQIRILTLVVDACKMLEQARKVRNSILRKRGRRRKMLSPLIFAASVAVHSLSGSRSIMFQTIFHGVKRSIAFR